MFVEIVVMYFLCRSIGDMLRKKGHDPIMYQVLTVLLWIGGEFIGGVLAVVASMPRGAQVTRDVAPYFVLGAVLGAATGAITGYTIAASAKPRRRLKSSRSSQSNVIFPTEMNAPPAGIPVGQAMIQFYCPQGHLLQEFAHSAGQQRTCPICHTPFMVPVGS